MERPQNTKNCMLVTTIQTRNLVGNYFFKDIEEGFTQLGYNCIIIDTKKVNYDEHKVMELIVETYLSNNIEFIFVNFVPWILLEYKGKSLWDYFECPVINFMVDAPPYYIQITRPKINNAIFTFVDKDNVKLMNEHLERKAFFVPHGACKNNEDKFIPYEKRAIDVLFAGNYVDPLIIYEDFKRKNDKKYIDIVELTLQYMFDNEECNYDEALFKILNINNISVDEKKDILGFFFIVDTLHRNILRKKVLNEVVSSGINVTCYGGGWDKTDLVGYPNFKYKGNADFNIILNEISNSKVVLNIIPFFKNGAHERIFSTMINESVCITDYNRYLGEEFCDNESILFFKYLKLNELPVKINRILNSEEDFNRIVKNAKSIVEKKHTWLNRAQDIINIVELYYKNKNL